MVGGPLEEQEEKMSEWIPVTKELPDDDRMVLISTKSERFPEIGYMDVFRSRIDYRKQYSAWVSCEGRHELPDGEVTAWMELPPKYEEKEQ